ncbi:MAG: ThiF family adenylyltransferase [Cyanosarcina radialis HA8281-LM2]|jgi:hypothetical protein|nr:ThiF family adenylyltransferase [Cyanosarcina radialis HA8281-LM2]
MHQPDNSPEIYLQIPPQMWQQFCQAMSQARTHNEETIGFFFCQRHQVSKRQIRYLPRAWVVPTPDCYERQSASGLVLKQEFHLYLLNAYLRSPGLHVVHIHTHAHPTPALFSDVDDRYESEYARFLSSHFPKKPRLISGVFDASFQQSQWRLWDRKGLSYAPVNFSHTWFQSAATREAIASPELMFARQKIFGTAFQKQLGQLSVALIGCGGIGSIFAELLGRLGVKNWVLIDPDRLETVNLNRLLAATPNMVEQQWYKVEYVKYLLKRIYPTGSSVTAVPAALSSSTVPGEIAACDLIVVATDNHYSRQIAQELAVKYMRPLICLGTHIDVKADGQPRMYCRVTVPPLGGGWCLMCGNIINLQRAALESASSDLQQIAGSAGYLEAIDDPAVFWLNSICASTAVGIVHGLVSGFLQLDSGIDRIYDFPASTWHQTAPEYLATPDCYFCSSRSSQRASNAPDCFGNKEQESPPQWFWEAQESDRLA